MAVSLVRARTSPSVTSEGLSVRVLLRGLGQVTGIKKPTEELGIVDDCDFFSLEAAEAAWQVCASQFCSVN